MHMYLVVFNPIKKYDIFLIHIQYYSFLIYIADKLFDFFMM